MKRTFLDKVITAISPEAGVRRAKARGKLDLMFRTYDAANTYKTDDWTSATAGDANKEIKAAQPILRDKARDAIRNNPYALTARDVVVTEVVGHGIVPNIKGKTPEQAKQVRDAWKIWGETNLCDAEGRLNYYGLQAAVMSSTYEDGEVLAKKLLVKEPALIRTEKGTKPVSTIHKIQLLETEFIDSAKNDEKTTQGVEVDANGKATGYWLFANHPGGEAKASASAKVDALTVKHIFEATRRGQRRGVTRYHSVLRTLEDLKNYQEATLIRQKVAACYTIFVTPGDSETGLPAAQQVAQREADATIEPGATRYLNPGETVNFATPPGVDGYDSYVRQHLRAVSVGLGITYEYLSGDFSQSNFSSSRMAKQKMNKNVDNWRWNMMIPLFCEPTFQWFLEWCQLAMGINTEGVYADWTPPAREFIDPITEIEAIKRSVRIGVKTQDEAIREQGYDPETFYLEVQATNKKMDDLGLAFDTDARKMSSVGFAQAGESFDKLLGNAPTEEKTNEENS